jgi:saccharopine dehydrogenase-like NADP-dependent oxidoreductase
MYRGTLRNVGYCETWDFIKQLGLLNRKMKFDFDAVTPREVLANIVNCRRKMCGRAWPPTSTFRSTP